MNSEEIDVDCVTHDDSEEDPIVIEKGTFSWETEGDAVLKNIDFKVPDGSMVAVVGVVGCGKSTLLSALLGELSKLYGKVNTKVSLGLVTS